MSEKFVYTAAVPVRDGDPDPYLFHFTDKAARDKFAAVLSGYADDYGNPLVDVYHETLYSSAGEAIAQAKSYMGWAEPPSDES